jgi:hypothetical protein
MASRVVSTAPTRSARFASLQMSLVRGRTFEGVASRLKGGGKGVTDMAYDEDKYDVAVHVDLASEQDWQECGRDAN